MFVWSGGPAHINLPDVNKLNPRTNVAAADWDLNRTYETNYLTKAVYKLVTKGTKPADVRLKVELTTDQTSRSPSW